MKENNPEERRNKLGEYYNFPSLLPGQLLECGAENAQGRFKNLCNFTRQRQESGIKSYSQMQGPRYQKFMEQSAREEGVTWRECEDLPSTSLKYSGECRSAQCEDAIQGQTSHRLKGSRRTDHRPEIVPAPNSKKENLTVLRAQIKIEKGSCLVVGKRITLD